MSVDAAMEAANTFSCNRKVAALSDQFSDYFSDYMQLRVLQAVFEVCPKRDLSHVEFAPMI